MKTKDLFFKIVDRFGVALMIATFGYGANQVKFLYKSINDLTQSVAVIGKVVDSQSTELRVLDDRVRYLERGRR